METPICVIDAKTLVDHIQVLKNWIYSGQLRLIVPSSTIEQVEQLYQKSIEPKPTTQEAPRSRSSGKPAKKEYPAFDINPRVAREYIGRLKSRKEQEANSEQWEFFQEKENHEAVRFQLSNEVYTPWKDLDVEEEKPEAIAKPPTSWAEALRRKQNLANGISEQSVSKAPAKPKLVARAPGSEASPWKVKNNAPKILPKDVPGALRPLMSCALWRLHESIERNDPNQLFLLSDQTEIQFIAQKLNITARSCKDIGTTIASKSCKTGLDTFGDLERDFGVQQKIVAHATQDAEETNEEISATGNVNGDVKDEDTMNHSVSSEETANTAASSIVHEQEFRKQSLEHTDEKPLMNGGHSEDNVKNHDGMVETTVTLTTEHVSKMPAKSVESMKSLADSAIGQDYEKHFKSPNGLKIDALKSETSRAHDPALEQPATLSPPTAPSPQPQNVESVQHIQDLKTISDTSPPKQTAASSTPVPEVEQELEDSDEEVVVFVPQPKRLSAQQRPAQQSSRPSTPKEQPQQKPAEQSPQKLSAKPQSKGKARRHSPNPSVAGWTQPQSVNSPTVIDPDAFGRDCRINPNPSPRLPHNSNRHSHHRTRGNMQNAQGGRMSRHSPRQLPRTSPPHNSPQESLQHLTPISGPVPKDASHHRRQTSRTSPPRGSASKTEEVPLTGVESKGLPAAVPSKPQSSESQVSKTTHFESDIATISPGWNTTRSTLPNPQLQPKEPRPRIFEANEFVPRPSRPVPDFQPRASRPKAFEAAEFVPRDFVPRTTMPRAQPKEQSSEIESIEPRPSINDVDYVLKSGSTRASARGRGRLWTPS